VRLLSVGAKAPLSVHPAHSDFNAPGNHRKPSHLYRALPSSFRDALDSFGRARQWALTMEGLALTILSSLPSASSTPCTHIPTSPGASLAGPPSSGTTDAHGANRAARGCRGSAAPQRGATGDMQAAAAAQEETPHGVQVGSNASSGVSGRMELASVALPPASRRFRGGYKVWNPHLPPAFCVTHVCAAAPVSLNTYTQRVAKMPQLRRLHDVALASSVLAHTCCARCSLEGGGSTGNDSTTRRRPPPLPEPPLRPPPPPATVQSKCAPSTTPGRPHGTHCRTGASL
jgi:hypothetical protein